MGFFTRRNIIVAGIFLAILILCVYFYFDPSDHFFPRCPFLSMTGLECPGCGSQRAIHALLHGDLAAVWHYNAALYVPCDVYDEYYYWAVNSRYVIWGTGIVIILWWILRNLI